MEIGFGISGAVPADIAAELARAAEAAGYAAFWTNDVPNGEGFAGLAAAASVTARIQLGVGVLPIDRWPVDRIVTRMRELRLPEERLLLGIGSGGLTSGSLAAVRDAVERLEQLTPARVLVGALGQKMCRVGAESAGGVLLNWLTPAQAAESATEIRAYGAAAGRHPLVAGYVRVALPGPAGERLTDEAARYASYPQYAAHFARMGVQAIDTCILGNRAEIAGRLAAFEGACDHMVVRAIAADESLASYLEVLIAGAPGATA